MNIVELIKERSEYKRDKKQCRKCTLAGGGSLERKEEIINLINSRPRNNLGIYETSSIVLSATTQASGVMELDLTN